MINPFKEINWKPDAAELRKFAISLLIGFPVIAVVFFLITWARNEPDVKTGSSLPDPQFFLLLGGIGAGVGLLCFLIRPLARLLYPVWYGIAACIGIVLANLLFTLLFYVLFTPLGLFMRLIGRDALALKMQDDAPTYWKDAPPERPAAHYFRQY